MWFVKLVLTFLEDYFLLQIVLMFGKLSFILYMEVMQHTCYTCNEIAMLKCWHEK